MKDKRTRGALQGIGVTRTIATRLVAKQSQKFGNGNVSSRITLNCTSFLFDQNLRDELLQNKMLETVKRHLGDCFLVQSLLPSLDVAVILTCCCSWLRFAVPEAVEEHEEEDVVDRVALGWCDCIGQLLT